jgi:hypothetical protein
MTPKSTFSAGRVAFRKVADMRVEIDWLVGRAFRIAKLGHHPENRKPSASKKLRR